MPVPSEDVEKLWNEYFESLSLPMKYANNPVAAFEVGARYAFGFLTERLELPKEATDEAKSD